jgi:hypothetical protein
MTQITFSHYYSKFIDPDIQSDEKVELVSVSIPFKPRVLSDNYLDYDTTYICPKTGNNLNYPLNKENDYITLTFFNPANDKFFTTIRPYNKQKSDYYAGLIGQLFEVVIKGDQK